MHGLEAARRAFGGLGASMSLIRKLSMPGYADIQKINSCARSCGLISHVPFATNQSLSRLPRRIPGSNNLTSRSEPDPRSTPILTIPAQIPVLIYIPTAVAGPHSSLSEPRRSGRSGRLLRLFPFLLAETIEFHLAGEQGRWFGEGGLFGRCTCGFRLGGWSRCGDGGRCWSCEG